MRGDGIVTNFMSPFQDAYYDHSDVETTPTVKYSTPSTASTAVFHEPPFLQRRPDHLPIILHISNALAIASFCCSIPFFGASTLFQTPFVATSTLEFNRGILNPPEPSSERQLLIKKRVWDEDFYNAPELPHSKRARTLTIRWALATFAVAAILGGWAVFSVKVYSEPVFTAWQYIACAEVVLDALQVVVMIMIWRRCRSREDLQCDGFEESLRRLLSRRSRYM